MNLNKVELGSQTAKNGFKNEKDIAKKFDSWKIDSEAQEWLTIMGYDLKSIEYVKVVILSGYKADINVQVQIKLKQSLDIENVQVKLVSNKRGFNQIDKRWLKNYTILWNIPDNIVRLLKYFTGESLGKVMITPKGSLKLGKITIQRKGGDGGRDTAKMLQFKIDPTELFNI